NLLPRSQARRSLAVDVVDARGRHTKPGAEVRVYAAGTRRLISSGPRRYRRRLLLAERGAGARRDGRSRARRRRGDVDGNQRATRNESRAPRSERGAASSRGEGSVADLSLA